MTNQLLEYYLNKPCKKVVMNPVSCENIMQELNRLFQNEWTWEISQEYETKIGNIITIVTLYLPGMVCTGRSEGKAGKTKKNHLKALLDACSRFIKEEPEEEIKETHTPVTPVKEQQPETIAEEVKPELKTYQESKQTQKEVVEKKEVAKEEEFDLEKNFKEFEEYVTNNTNSKAKTETVLDASMFNELASHDSNKNTETEQSNFKDREFASYTVHTREQFYNQTDKSGQPVDAIPYDKVSDECLEELGATVEKPSVPTTPTKTEKAIEIDPYINPDAVKEEEERLKREAYFVNFNKPLTEPIPAGKEIVLINEKLEGEDKVAGIFPPRKFPYLPIRDYEERMKPKPNQPVLSNGYTQDQINRVNLFKQQYEVLTNRAFDILVHRWDENLNSKSDLTPQNIESFLEWTIKLGKLGR